MGTSDTCVRLCPRASSVEVGGEGFHYHSRREALFFHPGGGTAVKIHEVFIRPGLAVALLQSGNIF